MTLGNNNGTDGQTDRQTDRVRRNMRPPSREKGRIINEIMDCVCPGVNVKLFADDDIFCF